MGGNNNNNDAERGMMDIPMAVAAAGVSMSMADVDFTKTGAKEGSQYTMMGMITIGLVGANCT